MPPQQNTSIKSYPNPNGASESKCNMLATLTDRLDTHLEPPSTTQDDKVLGKRVASTPPRPTKKRKTATGDKPHHLAYKDLSPSWLEAHHENRTKQVISSTSLTLTYHKGDMFADAPKGTLLIHACNTQGHWGAGIAKAFKTKYPNAYADHNKFCTKDHSRTNPVPTGTTQLLAPRDRDKEHWIGCVFTSAKYGKAKDKLDKIVGNTSKSMQMLLELVSQVDSEITEIRMCKINSGKFGVPWEKTEEVLQGLALKPQWRKTIEVWELVE